MIPERQDRDQLARTPLHEIVPGLWCLPIELPGLTVGHVMTYAIVTTAGIVLVDPGWDDEYTISQIESSLRQGPGAGVDDIIGIVATHAHVDHIGGAKWIGDRTGAWLAVHEAEPAVMQVFDRTTESALQDADRWLAALAVPVEKRPDMLAAVRSLVSQAQSYTADQLLVDGESLDVPGWDFEVQHTPGHTPGHLSLVSAAHNVVIGGDHIIPDLFPGPVVATTDRIDPLGSYHDSLRLSAERWEGRLVLPGHGTPFTDTPAQVDRIMGRAELFLDQTRSLVRQGHRTVWEIAQLLPWNGGWSSRTIRSKRAALGTTLAYLRRLETLGQVEITDSPILAVSPS